MILNWETSTAGKGGKRRIVVYLLKEWKLKPLNHFVNCFRSSWAAEVFCQFSIYNTYKGPQSRERETLTECAAVQQEEAIWAD